MNLKGWKSQTIDYHVSDPLEEAVSLWKSHRALQTERDLNSPNLVSRLPLQPGDCELWELGYRKRWWWLKHCVHVPYNSTHTPGEITSATPNHRGSSVERCIPITGSLIHENCEPWNSVAVMQRCFYSPGDIWTMSGEIWLSQLGGDTTGI